jgi:hypothetical protein
VFDLKPIMNPSNQSGIIGWHDEKRHRYYRRIWGGIAWPNPLLNRLGFVVVVAEDWEDQGLYCLPEQDEVPMRVLAEKESQNFSELMSMCVELSGKVKSWYCGPNNMAVTGLLLKFNDAQRAAGRPAFSHPSTAPLIGGNGQLEEVLKFGISRIRSRGQRGILNLEDSPLVRACLQNIQPGAPAELEDFPALVALCFVVVALDRIPYVHPMAEKRPSFALTDYDLFKGPEMSAHIMARTGYSTFND